MLALVGVFVGVGPVGFARRDERAFAHVPFGRVGF
jgi:hypothetical protein